MTSPTATQPATASKLGRQIRWGLAGVAIVALAVVSSRGGFEPGSSSGGSDQPNRCTVTVTADVLNVRAGPGTQFGIVDRLERGTRVDGRRETSGQFRMLSEGRWVASEFIRTSRGCE
jgi:hypothetical protein